MKRVSTGEVDQAKTLEESQRLIALHESDRQRHGKASCASVGCLD